MKKKSQHNKTSQRMLPPLDNLTFEDWARICDKVEAKYESKVPDGFVMQEDER
jgi:hypothetical protein